MKFVDRVFKRSAGSERERKERKIADRQREGEERLKMLEAQARVTLRRG